MPVTTTMADFCTGCLALSRLFHDEVDHIRLLLVVVTHSATSHDNNNNNNQQRELQSTVSGNARGSSLFSSSCDSVASNNSNNSKDNINNNNDTVNNGTVDSIDRKPGNRGSLTMLGTIHYTQQIYIYTYGIWHSSGQHQRMETKSS